MNKTILIIVVVLLGCLIGIGGYFFLKSSYQTSAPVSTLTPASGVDTGTVEEKIISEETSEVTASEEITPSSVSSEEKEFTVSGTEYKFNPSSITVKTGDQVKIIFKNDGRLRHNLVIEGLGISTRTIGADQTDIVEFTAPASGTYTIFCSISGHRLAGMEGLLKVE